MINDILKRFAFKPFSVRECAANTREVAMKYWQGLLMACNHSKRIK